MEETILEMVELVRMGNMEDLGELVKVGKEIEMKKPNNAVAGGTGSCAHGHDQGGEGVNQGGVGGGGGQFSGEDVHQEVTHN